MKSYRLNCDVPEPVLLNCWKHHAGFIKSKISDYREHPGLTAGPVEKEILRIGGSIMDLYLGDLTPQEIAGFIISHLTEVSGRGDYTKWLYEDGKDYTEAEAPDRSRWTLRLGERADRFVHIHPSRYSPKTIRVRSSTLKSAILFCVLNKSKSENMLSDVNFIRKKYLNLPPLKNLNSASSLIGLVKIMT